jgi:hypothetical protein
MISEVRFELEQRGEQVFLRLTHSRLPENLMAGVGAGWHVHLDHVIALVKGEQPLEFFSQFNPLLQEYKTLIAAAGIVIASTSGTAAVASPVDTAYDTIGTIERRPGGGFFAVDLQFVGENRTTKLYQTEDPQLDKNFDLFGNFGKIAKQLDFGTAFCQSPETSRSGGCYIARHSPGL